MVTPTRITVEGFKKVFSMILDTWQEVDQRKDFGMSLSPDWETFTTLEEAGSFFGYLLGDKGYAIFVVYKDLHRKNKRIATSSVIYLEKGQRGGFSKYLPTIERDLKDFGVDMLSITVKTRSEGSLYDYKLYEESYQKAL